MSKINLVPVFDANHFLLIERKKTAENAAYEWARSIRERHPAVRKIRAEAKGMVNIGDAKVSKMLQDMLATDNELHRHFNAIHLARLLGRRLEQRRDILEDGEKHASQLQKIVDDFKKEIILNSRGKNHQRQLEVFAKLSERAWENQIATMVIITNALEQDIAEYQGHKASANNNTNDDHIRSLADKPRVEARGDHQKDIKHSMLTELKRVEDSRQLLSQIRLNELNLKLAAHEIVARYGLLKDLHEYTPKGKNSYSPKIVTGIVEYKKKNAA